MNTEPNNQEKKALAFQFEKITDAISKTPVFFAILTILIIAVYGKTILYEYTYLDDKVIIVDNIFKQKNVLDVKEAFSRDAFFSNDGLPFYRPLQNLSYMIDGVIGGKNVAAFHLTNIVLHILTCFSVFYMFILMKHDRKVSALITAIYAIHPIFTHAVAWIPSRGDLLIALFGILSFITFIKFIETKKIHFLALNVLTFALAMFSKETAILFPLIYAVYFFFVLKKKKIDQKLLIAVLAWIAIAAAFFAARSSVVMVVPGDESFGLQSFIKNIPTLPEITAKFFIPLNLSTMPKFTSFGTSFGSLIMAAFLVLIIMSKGRNKGLLILGAVWFFLFAVPPMAYRHNYADFGYEYFEHRAYLPMLGLFLMLIELYKHYKVKIDSKIIIIAVLGIILIFSAVTFVNAENYKNINNFFGRAIALDPLNALGNYNIGNYYKDKQKPKVSAYYFEKAIKANPAYLEAYQNLADVYNYMGRRKDAIKLLTKSISVNSYYYNAWKYLGMIYNQDAQYQKSMEALYGALRLRQKDHELFNLMGVTFMNLGKKDSAVVMFKKSLELKPDYKESISFLSTLYKDMGDLSKSQELLEKSKTTGKESVDSYISLGEIYGRQGNFDKSLEALDKALKLDPKNARVYNNIGTAYAIQKKFKQAADAFENAVKFDSLNSSYWFNLGLAFNDTKQRNKAISAIKKSADLGYPVATQWLNDNKISL